MEPVNPAASPSQFLQMPNNPLLAAASDQVNPQQPAPTATDSSQAGPSTLQNPTQPPFGASLGSMIMGKGQSLPSVTSPHATKIGDAITKTIAENPEAAAAPGGVMRAVVAGGLSALSKGLTGLGDAAHAPTSSSGALTGVENALHARTQRMAGEKQQKFENDQTVLKNNAMTAEANVRMLKEQRLIHNLDEDAKMVSIKNGQMQLETMKNQAIPGATIAKGVTHDQIAPYIESKKFSPSQDTAVPDGIKTVGQDKDGNPITSITYTLVKVPDDIVLNPDDKDQKKNLDFLNKWNPPKDGKYGDGGHQNFTGPQYNMAMQQAHDAQAADLTREQNTINAGFKENEVKKGQEVLDFAHDATLMHALSAAPNGDIMAARNRILADPNVSSKYPNLDNDIREWMGYTEGKDGKKDFVYDKMREDYQKKLDDRLSIFKQEQTKVDAAHGEEAAGLASTYADKAKNETDPLVKAQYQKWSDQLTGTASASKQYDVDKKAQETAAETQASEGDLSSVMDMVKNYSYDPDKLFSRFKGMKQKQEFIAELHRQDPNWKESTYRARYNTAQDYLDPAKKGGQAVQSLQTFTGHLADANSLIQSLGNTNMAFLNKPINVIKDQWGSDKIGAFDLALNAVNHEYQSFLLSQHAEHEIDKKAMEENTSHNSSPAKIQANLRQMVQTVAIRGRSMNNGYRKIMGENIPELLDDGQKNALRTFGIDPEWITNADNQGTSTPSQPKPKSAQIPPPPKGMVAMKDPSGHMGYVPEDQVAAAKAKGATSVQ